MTTADNHGGLPPLPRSLHELKVAHAWPFPTPGYTADQMHERDQAVVEACARLCDEMVLYTGYDCAAAIRAKFGVKS
jgi:hypothetical protein